MLDDNSFDSQSFSTSSWLLEVPQMLTRFIVRLKSQIVTVFSVDSKV